LYFSEQKQVLCSVSWVQLLLETFEVPCEGN